MRLPTHPNLFRTCSNNDYDIMLRSKLLSLTQF